ncbi:MAG: response regulator, partial [SAR324 cluster bacterium]|nr:response regulator [SAR324 cluster bacterium]
MEARNGRKIPFNIVLHAGTYEVSCDFEELARILLRTLQGLRKESATGQDVKIEIRNRRFFDKDGRNHYGVKAGAYVEFVLSALTSQETDEGRRDFYAKGGGAPLILRKIMEEIKILGGAFIASADKSETSYGLVVPAVSQLIEPNIEKVTHPDPRQMGTILVAENDDNILSLIESGLKLKGYSVISTEDGKKALKTFEKKMDDIALIFADMDLPHLTGTDLLLSANKLKPNIRVLLTSS